MRYARLRRTLTAALGLALVSGLARGDDALAGKKSAPVDSTVVVSDSDTEAAPARPRLARLKPVSLMDKWRNRTPCGCYSHFNDYSCSSLKAEWQFLFGGCRMFYGEACLKDRPPSPVPGFDERAAGVARPGGGVGFTHIGGIGVGRGTREGGVGGNGIGGVGAGCPSCR